MDYHYKSIVDKILFIGYYTVNILCYCRINSSGNGQETGVIAFYMNTVQTRFWNQNRYLIDSLGQTKDICSAFIIKLGDRE